jgi:hypothetical protein
MNVGLNTQVNQPLMLHSQATHGTLALEGKNTEAWIMTQSGRMFFFENPDPRSIVIEDIAHALHRFAGLPATCAATTRLLSTACGSVGWQKRSMARVCQGRLLHDAAEAYVSDLNGPLKRLVGEGYKKWEEVAEDAVGTGVWFQNTKEQRS